MPIHTSYSFLSTFKNLLNLISQIFKNMGKNSSKNPFLFILALFFIIILFLALVILIIIAPLYIFIYYVFV